MTSDADFVMPAASPYTAGLPACTTHEAKAAAHNMMVSALQALRPETGVPLLCYAYFLSRYLSPLYGGVGLLALGAYFFGLSRWEKISASPLGGWALSAVVFGLPALGFCQFLLLGDQGDLDQSSYACALWNFRHGTLNYSFGHMNMFGIHSQYTSLLWVPWHALTGDVGLKLGKYLCLIAAAGLAFYPLRRQRQTAYWGTAALLLSPPIASQFFFGFHPEFIGAPVLILALHAYRRQNLPAFLAATGFLAFSKESYTMAIAGILLVALIEKRNWKWILLPGLLCCAQMALYWYVIMPRFAPNGNFLSFMMPASWGQVVEMWARPKVFGYAFHVALPFLPLLLAQPRRYWLLPLPLMAFYAAFPDPLFMVMWPNYTFPLALLCVGGLILNARAMDAERTLSRLLFACAMTSLLSYPLWREAFSLPMGNLPMTRELNKVRALIPEDAAVVVNGPFTARFASRKEVAIWGSKSLWGVRPQSIDHFDYAVMDATFKPKWLIDEGELRRGLDSLSDQAQWTRIYAKDSLFVFRKNGYLTGI